MRRLALAALAAALVAPAALAQPAAAPSPPLRRTPTPGLDVLDYRFQLSIRLEERLLHARATVRTTATHPIPAIVLDLVEVDAEGKGMRVLSVSERSGEAERPLPFQHRDGLLTVERALAPGDTLDLAIVYSGVPKDGLVISTNRYGAPTAFGDNWPMRARHWLPTNDHLSDKATVTFVISTPPHDGGAVDGAVANGRRVPVKEPLGIFHPTYRSDVPIPTKVMVVGVAPFAVQTVGEIRPGVPVESWVFPQDSVGGFREYAAALPIVRFFEARLGLVYPYEKLANVQSKTIYGGMENAGAIFYHEASVKGDGSSEALLAHEIAHQWFGNGATEADWPHLWLSEGFATYLTEVYLESKYGTPRLRADMARARTQVVAFLDRTPLPLVDTVTADVSTMLTANPYQRGAWVLHMLRTRLGEAAFFDGLRRYYAAHGLRQDARGRWTSGPNATTDDLRRAMEATSGQDLRAFFRDWTTRPDVPRLAATLRHDARRREAVVTVRQTQPGAPFAFPLTVDVDGARRRVEVTGRTATVRVPARTAPRTLTLDPDTALLFAPDAR